MARFVSSVVPCFTFYHVANRLSHPTSCRHCRVVTLKTQCGLCLLPFKRFDTKKSMPNPMSYISPIQTYRLGNCVCTAVQHHMAKR